MRLHELATIIILDSIHLPAFDLKHAFDNVPTSQEKYYVSATCTRGYCDLYVCDYGILI
jgi:hypothetical protein